MALDYESRLLIAEHYDVYDLVELLGVTVEDIIDLFDLTIEDNPEIMEKIGKHG